jgi:hypothetical protein
MGTQKIARTAHIVRTPDFPLLEADDLRTILRTIPAAGPSALKH